jgi:hypothetical protein
MLAVSTAADELTPFPSGTSEATAIRMPDVSRQASLPRQDEHDARDVRRPAIRTRLEHAARVVVAGGHTAGRQHLERIVHAGRPRLTISSSGRSTRRAAAQAASAIGRSRTSDPE